ncbi:MAG: hypothetical protein ABIB79_01290, partial [archaeon]
TRSRTLHVNLDKVDNVIKTEPAVQVDWLVPALGAGNWRPIKGGDCWERGQVNKIKLVGHKEADQTVKWSFDVGEKVNIDPIWESPTEYINKIKNESYINELRIIDSVRVKKGDFFKSYDTDKKIILIEDKSFNKVIELKFNSLYEVSGLIASPDTQLFKFFLIDWKDGREKLFDNVQALDLKDNYKEETKTFWYKYRFENEVCKEACNNSTKICGEQCYNNTEWINFNFLSELPHKEIEVAIYTNTVVREKKELVFSIEDIKILEWANYEVSTASFAMNFSFTEWDSQPQGITFGNSGAEMYIVSEYKNISQFSLSIPYNVTSASYTGGKDISPQVVAGARALVISDDGTKIIVLTLNGDLWQYTLSTPFLVSSATYVGTLDGPAPTGMGLEKLYDGKILLAVGGTGNNWAVQYNCTTAWNLATCSLKADNMSLQAGFPGEIYAISAKPDLSEVFIGFPDHANNVSVITLSITNQNISQWTYASTKYFILSGWAGVAGPSELRFNDDGTRMFVLTYHLDNSIMQYTIAGTPSNPDINWSSNLGNLVFQNCSPDWEFYPSAPNSQTASISSLNATNNGSATGTFQIEYIGSLNTGWTLFSCNDSSSDPDNDVDCFTLTNAFQEIWGNVAANDEKQIWLYGNCSSVSANPGVTIDMGAV